MQLSKHAQKRAQQRAIPPMLIDLLIQFGSSERSGTGVSRMYFDKPSRKRVKVYAGILGTLLDEHLDVYAVVTDDLKVITTGHRTQRIRNH
jgi:hypothetical protein